MGDGVKKLALFATISQLALIAGTGANAADLPRKAPAMLAPVAPAYSWTGCYAGVHVGYGWARSDVSESNVSVGPGGSGSVTSTLDSDGAVYGGQLGCNYQFQTGAFDTKWVVGIQGDFAGTNLRGDVADPFNPFLGGITGTMAMKTQWLASVTGRVGITAWDNRALIYAKGGVAWVQNKWDSTASGYCVFYAIYNGCDPNLRDNRTGWTAGAGGEFLISPSWPNWTAFVEYDYYRFDSGADSFVVGVTNPIAGNAITPGDQSIHVVKLGMNYKLFRP
jgi:outer membrane immunogenic protein